MDLVVEVKGYLVEGDELHLRLKKAIQYSKDSYVCDAGGRSGSRTFLRNVLVFHVCVPDSAMLQRRANLRI
eukprot:9570596-Alexandrium_andersonii.AAC.1